MTKATYLYRRSYLPEPTLYGAAATAVSHFAAREWLNTIRYPAILEEHCVCSMTRTLERVTRVCQLNYRQRQMRIAFRPETARLLLIRSLFHAKDPSGDLSAHERKLRESSDRGQPARESYLLLVEQWVAFIFS